VSDLPETRASAALDALLRPVAVAVSWIWPILIAVVTANVVLRYVFGWGLIQLEELQWHLYAVGFSLALADGVVADSHIRIDVLRTRMSATTRAWIELYGITLLLLPFTLLVLVFAVPFVAHSFSIGEVSGAPGGLPFRWLIKGICFSGFALLFLAACSRLLRVTSCLFGVPRSLGEAGPR
jgi:TRAP-type mannitol/chloroaromatic compound transport system permease small subunit